MHIDASDYDFLRCRYVEFREDFRECECDESTTTTDVENADRISAGLVGFLGDCASELRCYFFEGKRVHERRCHILSIANRERIVAVDRLLFVDCENVTVEFFEGTPHDFSL